MLSIVGVGVRVVVVGVVVVAVAAAAKPSIAASVVQAPHDATLTVLSPVHTDHAAPPSSARIFQSYDGELQQRTLLTVISTR